LPWTHAGLPAITLPAGQAENGLPLGLQLVARLDADEETLGWAQRLMDLVAPSLQRTEPPAVATSAASGRSNG
jgi:Asp-tRNA(Asn)/Glu-tRNA(Gln) amidotransferase A subunit family amidase